jgi:hypothetical protein
MKSFAAKRLIINKEAKLARSLVLRVLLLLQHPDLDYRNHNTLLWSKTFQKLQTLLALHLCLSLSLRLSVCLSLLASSLLSSL